MRSSLTEKSGVDQPLSVKPLRRISYELSSTFIILDGERVVATSTTMALSSKASSVMVTQLRAFHEIFSSKKLRIFSEKLALDRS